MTSEKNTIPATLATVKHGGCVQLPTSERERFEAWAEPRKHTLTRWGDSPGDVKPLFVSEVAGNYISPAAQAAWEAWQHLSAQPSTGGQDALADAARRVLSDVDSGDYHGEISEATYAALEEALAARQPVGEPVEHACTNCDRMHAEVICPACAGIAWDNGRLHEFHEVRELSTSLGEGVLDHLFPDEWHEKPLLRFQGAYDEGDDSVGISPRSANVLAEDQNGTVLGDYLAARAAKEGGQ